MSLQFKSGIIVLVLAFVALSWTSLCLGQSPQPALAPAGSIHGTVVDQSGAMVAGARLKLAGEDPSRHQETVSGNDGQFAFANVAPGRFQITITSAGFASQTLSGTLHAGESYTIPNTALAVPNPSPMWKSASHRSTWRKSRSRLREAARAGRAAKLLCHLHPECSSAHLEAEVQVGMEDGDRSVHLGGCGGSCGSGAGARSLCRIWARRAGLCKSASAPAMPIRRLACSLVPPYCHRFLKQDPRYFYKGTGSTRSRALYAIANSFVCKGDNGRWQTNYSNILGSLAAGGISNLYYPRQDRNGLGLTFENAAWAWPRLRSRISSRNSSSGS